MKIPLAFDLGVPRKDGKIIHINNFINIMQSKFEDKNSDALIVRNKPKQDFVTHFPDIIGAINYMNVDAVEHNQNALRVSFEVKAFTGWEAYFEYMQKNNECLTALFSGKEYLDGFFYINKMSSFYYEHEDSYDTTETFITNEKSKAIKDLEELAYKVNNFKLQM